MNFNRVTLAGNLTRDPELRYTPKGTAVCKITLAINRKWKTESGEMKEETTFVDVDIFGKVAEAVGQYLAKGRGCLVDGRLRLEEWTDKTTGQKRSKLGVVAESVQFDSPRDGNSPRAASPAPRATAEAKEEHDDAPIDGQDTPF